MTIARRTAFAASAGLLAAPAILALATPAAAQTAAPAQGPGFYRFKTGAWTITTVHDGFFSRPVEGFVRNAPVADVQGILAENFMSTTALPIPFTITFAQKDSSLIVFDAGNGVTPAAATNGKMFANMAAAGIDPARVTHVIHSHFHGDHINGLITPTNTAAFPNAEVLVPTTEWAWWTEASNESRSPEGQRAQFANVPRRFAPYAGKIRQFAPGSEVIPGITSIAAHGHTPGHTIFRVADGNEQMMFISDVTNRPEFMMRRPEWQIVFDFDGEAAAATRRRVLDMVAMDRVRITGYHFPFPANGHVARHVSGGVQGFIFVPAEWSSAI